MKRIGLAFALLLSVSCIAQAPVPKNGFVPNRETAIEVTKAVLKPMIGEIGVKSQVPFHAELHDGIWEVLGRWEEHPTHFGGGGVDIKINQKTGAIVGYYFMK